MKLTELAEKLKREIEYFETMPEDNALGCVYSTLTQMHKELDKVMLLHSPDLFIADKAIPPTIDIHEKEDGIKLILKEKLPHRIKYDRGKPKYQYNIHKLQSGYYNSFEYWITERGRLFDKYTSSSICITLCYNIEERVPDYDNLDIKPLIDAIAAYLIVDDSPRGMALSFAYRPLPAAETSYVEIEVHKREGYA